MNQFIFKSRWIAIAFATLTLFSVYAFVGGEDDGGLFGGIRSDLVEQRDETASELAAIGTPEPVLMPEMEMMVDEEFVDDGELIDSASGDDPSPDDEGGFADDSGDAADSEPQMVTDADVIDQDSFEENFEE